MSYIPLECGTKDPSVYADEASSRRLKVRDEQSSPVQRVIKEGRYTSHSTPKTLSAWSGSSWKRAFDVACVLCSLPIALPIILVCATAVWLTSDGPVLFRQKRMGRDAGCFTIYKFRTMPVVRAQKDRPNITTIDNQRFTPVGPFLRRWKLDELPQLFNVLRGDMSLVGPRPKLPSHQPTSFNCRPGITGLATFTFAREEVILADIPVSRLDAYCREVILPYKQLLDDEYMEEATFSSDFRLIWKSVFRKWGDLDLRDLPFCEQFEQGHRTAISAKARFPHIVVAPQAETFAQLQD